MRAKPSPINQGHRAVERTRAVHLYQRWGNCRKSGIRARTKVWERAELESVLLSLGDAHDPGAVPDPIRCREWRHF